MTTDRIDKSTLYPALAGFFIMGFCDIVAPITGKIAEQYADHATLVGFLPSMVFLWLFLISTPLASLANRYGRKSVALAGYAGCSSPWPWTRGAAGWNTTSRPSRFWA